MARLAHFTGTLRVREYRPSDSGWLGLLVNGSMSLGGRVITVHVNHTAPHVHGSGRGKNYDPLATFGHELGHYIMKQRGRQFARAYRSTDEYQNSPIERACDRYSRLLRSKS